MSPSFVHMQFNMFVPSSVGNLMKLFMHMHLCTVVILHNCRQSELLSCTKLAIMDF